MNKITNEMQERAFIEMYHMAKKENSGLPDIPSPVLRKCYWLALKALLDTMCAAGEGAVAPMLPGYGKFEVRKRNYSGVNLSQGGVGTITAYRVHYAPGERTKWRMS